MKNQNNNQQTGFNANVQVYLNEEQGNLTHVLMGDVRIVMPINLYKQILGIPFTKKVQENEVIPALRTYGLLARPRIYLSEDGNYLIHNVLGIRISKHVNYYKKILGNEYTPKIQTA